MLLSKKLAANKAWGVYSNVCGRVTSHPNDTKDLEE